MVTARGIMVYSLKSWTMSSSSHQDGWQGWKFVAFCGCLEAGGMSAKWKNH
jgi:hypothetical protein